MDPELDGNQIKNYYDWLRIVGPGIKFAGQDLSLRMVCDLKKPIHSTSSTSFSFDSILLYQRLTWPEE
jgi:hypothetical protein